MMGVELVATGSHLEMKIELTNREWNELQWFIRTVLNWGSGGPYGDGDTIVEKGGEALMNRISEKIRVQREHRFDGAVKARDTLTSIFNKARVEHEKK
jgi:hypothetical protein